MGETAMNWRDDLPHWVWKLIRNANFGGDGGGGGGDGGDAGGGGAGGGDAGAGGGGGAGGGDAGGGAGGAGGDAGGGGAGAGGAASGSAGGAGGDAGAGAGAAGGDAAGGGVGADSAAAGAADDSSGFGTSEEADTSAFGTSQEQDTGAISATLPASAPGQGKGAGTTDDLSDTAVAQALGAPAAPVGFQTAAELASEFADIASVGPQAATAMGMIGAGMLGDVSAMSGPSFGPGSNIGAGVSAPSSDPGFSDPGFGPGVTGIQADTATMGVTAAAAGVEQSDSDLSGDLGAPGTGFTSTHGGTAPGQAPTDSPTFGPDPESDPSVFGINLDNITVDTTDPFGGRGPGPGMANEGDIFRTAAAPGFGSGGALLAEGNVPELVQGIQQSQQAQALLMQWAQIIPPNDPRWPEIMALVQSQVAQSPIDQLEARQGPDPLAPALDFDSNDPLRAQLRL